MSTLIYDNSIENAGYDLNIESFLSRQNDEFTFLSMNSIGQDAGYIVRKRALLLDLWNLLPEIPAADRYCHDLPTSPDLPINTNKSSDYCYTAMEKNIPVQ